MQKLYELVLSWGREHKDQLQQVLWITNRALVAELEGSPPQKYTIMSNKCDLSKEEKVWVICHLLYQAPPGEFCSVFEDLRILVQDDDLMRQEAAQVCAHHNKNNFTLVRIKGTNVLVTRYNDLGGNRFFDPKNKFSFKFDHLSGISNKFQLHRVAWDETELWRTALNSALKAYVNSHFPSGDCSVFRKTLKNRQIFVVCIAGHQYKQLGFWNCLWKGEWTFSQVPVITQVTGAIHMQVHYFKDANLHMTVCKTVEETLHVIDPAQLAIDFVKLIKTEDNKFHIAMLENFQALTDEIWRKILRRQLPVTRTVINWNKLLTNQSMKANISSCEVPLSVLKCTV
ncbi:F-actin-capping protein subunit alpha-2 [Chelonia mydas]|uniref:F-actin-capping protein subunit alpha n=1 Tax=Chelonia mydas TaxID=8469 RepID=M7AKP7_CHEMY|nr:F-actin-capping protein subunit alpha-2 [Chelonia mydas]